MADNQSDAGSVDGRGDGDAGRRRFLKGIGSLGVIGLAGCFGDDGSTDTPTEAGTDTPTDTPPGRTTTDTTAPPDTPTPRTLDALVVTETNGHTGHPTEEGIAAVEDLVAEIAADRGFVVGTSVDHVADDTGAPAHVDAGPAEFPRDVETLSGYDVVVLNNCNDTTPPQGEGSLLFDDEQAGAFADYVRSGGGVVAVHASSVCQTADSTYTDVVGAYFDEETTSPRVQDVTFTVTDRTHPSTAHLPAEWEVSTEVYTFLENPRGDVHVLASIDQTSYDGPILGGNGHRHPMVWCRNVGAGRSWYTQLGHTADRFDDPAFLQHLRGGIEWAAGLVDGDASGTVRDAYEKTRLVADSESPSVVTVAPGGRVYYVDRTEFNDVEGATEEIRVVNEEAGESRTVIELPVANRRLPGLRSFVLDPEFEDTRRMYLYYHPPMDEIDEGHFRLSRFTMESGLLELDPDSEEIIMEVPKYEFDIDDARGGHCGGSLSWGPDGEQLYLTTGDDTYWDASDFYTPVDERDGREWNDAQRTSGSTADLRGSVLRISPNEDGSYEVPDGNLVDTIDGGSEGEVAPELYATGFRNPYRMAVDPESGVPYVADYGPDAGAWNADRGPPGTTEYARVDEPGFYGWPYFTGDAVPYREYDYGTGESGRIFDPEGPTNDSPNNDGLTELPPAKGTMIASPYNWSTYLEFPDAWAEHVPYERSDLDSVPFPQVTGGSPLVGTVFRDREGYGSGALSAYFDGKVLFMDRAGGWIKYATVDDGSLVDVEPFLPGTEFTSPMDLTVGPEGALYVVEWGSNYHGPNADSGIYRVETVRRDVSVDVTGLRGETIQARGGETVTVGAITTNPHEAALEDGQLALASSGGELPVSAVEGTSFGTLPAREGHEAAWEVSVPEAAQGEYAMEIEATYTESDTGEERTVTEEFVLAVPDRVSAPFGLNAGDDSSVTVDGLEFVPTPHESVEAFGDAGASGSDDAVAVSGTDDPISGTDHDDLYGSLLYGGDLSFEIAIENGTYDVTLHFVENVHTSPGSRVFDVAIEGETVLSEVDVYEEVGIAAAHSETIRGVEVADGSLSIHTTTVVDNTSVCGIEIRS